jgi:hypothetical protein
VVNEREEDVMATGGAVPGDPSEDDPGAAVREALAAVQEARKSGDYQRVRSADARLKQLLLTTVAPGINVDMPTVAAAVRLFGEPDDNGTTRLEVRDQAMTRRRWFEVDVNGEVTWDDR